MGKFLSKINQTLLAGIVLLGSVGGLLLGPMTGSVAAAKCHKYSTSAYIKLSGYRATDSAKVPFGSPCRDINILGGRSIFGDRCGYYRVRFYPRSGGNYANGWQYLCSSLTSPTLQVIASNVIEGTRYRIEVSGSTTYLFTVYD